MKRWLRDTLFKRLFGLMCVALVASHVVAFLVVTGRGGGPFASGPPGGGRGGPPPGALHDGLRPGPADGPFMSRPAAPPRDASGWPPPGEPEGPPPAMARETHPPPPVWSSLPPATLPRGDLILDYGVRLLVIGLAAWWGARWLAGPTRRLVGAAHGLAATLRRGEPPPHLDDAHGVHEVREAAQVFNDMARQLHEQFNDRSLLMAAISHDLRTPLTRMRMRLESSGDADAARSIADIREMDALLEAALDVFRGSSTPEPVQPTDVLALVQSLVDDLQELGQPVIANGESAVAAVQPTALRRVLANLLSNALRYGERADVSVRRTSDGVHIVVDDHGPGIPDAQLEAVFRPFYRVEGSRSRATGGTGLGLHIARDLVVRQGGTLSLSNRPEGGLRAVIAIPAVPAGSRA